MIIHTLYDAKEGILESILIALATVCQSLKTQIGRNSNGSMAICPSFRDILQLFHPKKDASGSLWPGMALASVIPVSPNFPEYSAG